MTSEALDLLVLLTDYVVTILILGGALIILILYEINRKDNE